MTQRLKRQGKMKTVENSLLTSRSWHPLKHRKKIIVYMCIPTDLGMEVIDVLWLTCSGGRLLQQLPLMSAPAGRGCDAGRTINYRTAIRMNERFSCRKKFKREKPHEPVL